MFSSLRARRRAKALRFGVITLLGGVLVLTGSACYQGGSSLPSEVSAVSSKQTQGVASIFSQLKSHQVGRQMVESLPAESDYEQVQVRKFVELRALDTFEILSSIFDAFRQTNYQDHIDDGWYRAMVSFSDSEEGGAEQTRLEEWFVRSRTWAADGNIVNRIEVIIHQMDGGELELVRVEVDILKAPTVNEDGSLSDMGEWTIRAAFGPEFAEEGSFHATAEILDSGQSLVTIQENFVEDMPGGGESQVGSRALIVRSETDGYGVVEFPDWEQCWMGGDCSQGVPIVEARFSYNESYLTIARGGEAPVSFDRNDAHDLVHRYALFDGTTGDSVERTMSFGFPVQTGSGQHGWYGAWQDHHELWIGGEPAQDGMTVTRTGLPDEETPPTYTVARFDGSLTRIELVPGNLDQLDGVTAEVQLWQDFRLRWNLAETRWDECFGDDGSGGCDTLEDFTQRLPSLAPAGEADRRNVWVNGCFDDGQAGWTCTEFVYVDAGPLPGFYEAVWDQQTGRPIPTETRLDEASLADDDQLWVGIGGQTYIQYTGEFQGPATNTGWVEKTVTAFDSESWTPTFDDGADREFAFELGREYFVNQRGSNLRVTRVAESQEAADYAVFMEKHRVAKPSDSLATVIAPGTLLVNAWDPENSSRYALNVDPASPEFMLLEIADASQQDLDNGLLVGDVVVDDLWGLRVDGDTTALEDAVLYNWVYAGPGEGWGGVSYLVDDLGGFVFLHEQLRFEPVSLPRTDDLVQERPEGEWLQYSLAYDGWLQGVPDTWWELQRIGFDPNEIPTVLANNVVIPDGTVLTDSTTLDTYLVKAVDIGIFLGFVTEFTQGPAPDMTSANDIDLDLDLPETALPTLLSTAPPADVPLLYVEGIPVG